MNIQLLSFSWKFKRPLYTESVIPRTKAELELCDGCLF